MTNASSKAISQAYEACRECEESLRNAIPLVEQEALRDRLATRALAWNSIVNELQPLVHGDLAQRWTSSMAALGRAWLLVKSAVNDEQAILERCAHLEQAAQSSLRAAVECGLPSELGLKLQAASDRAKKQENWSRS